MPQYSDALVRSYDHVVSVPAFEGPLDLLLFLIRKNEIDIYDIPIESVTRQYIDMLRQMETQHLELAGEFFVMAATLMAIKSRMLLPKEQQKSSAEDEDEPGHDPRWELIQQLVEYKRFKEISAKIDHLAETALANIPRMGGAEAITESERPLRPSDRIEIWNAFNQVLQRLSERIVVGEIHADLVTVADRMALILERIKTVESFSFMELCAESGYHLNTIVASFLAILELARLREIDLVQSELYGDILCQKASEDPIVWDEGNNQDLKSF